MKRFLVAITFAASAMVFNSCGPSKYTVVEQPVAPVYERPVSPRPAYVWVDGNWRWNNGRYVYKNGYWAKPKSNRKYVSGVWVRNNKGYYWKKGYWK